MMKLDLDNKDKKEFSNNLDLKSRLKNKRMDLLNIQYLENHKKLYQKNVLSKISIESINMNEELILYFMII